MGRSRKFHQRFFVEFFTEDKNGSIASLGDTYYKGNLQPLVTFQGKGGLGPHPPFGPAYEFQLIAAHEV